MPEISTITGKPFPTFDEKVEFGKNLYGYLKGNLFPKSEPGTEDVAPREWRDPKDPNFQESIFADRPREITYAQGSGKKGLPKYAGSINIKRQLISDKAKQLEVAMFEKFGVKTKVTHKQVIDEANKVIKRFNDNPDHYFKRMAEIQAGAKPTYGEDLAMRMRTADDFEEFVLAAKKVEAGELPIENLQAIQNIARERALKITSPTAADAGRRLNFYNITVGQESAMNALKNLEKPLTKHQAKLLSQVNFDAPPTIDRFLQSLKQPKLKDYFYEYWYNSILSGVPTHVVNVASNTMWRMFQYPHRAAAASFDTALSVLGGRPRERFFREIPSMVGASLKAKPKAAKAAINMFRTGTVGDFETKWAYEMGSTLGAFERSRNAAVRGAGKVITIPTRALRAMDVYANTIAYDSQMAALATRTSIQKGIKGAAKRSDFKKLFKENPPQWAHDEAMKFAKYSTFTDDPGNISQSIINARNKIPGFRLVIPFVNTVGNLMKRGLEMTPGLGLGLARGQHPAELLAKQFEGSIITALILRKAMDGEMTGSAPDNKEQKEAFYRQGKKPWAIKHGDNWIQYRRIEPFNTVFASAASAYDGISKAKDGTEADRIFMNVVNDVKNNLIDSGYLQGVSQLINRHGKLDVSIKRFATSLVPFSGFWRSINRAYEAANEGNAKLYDDKGWLGAFGQVIPGLYKLQKPSLNVWGEEKTLEGGMLRQWLPYRWSKATDDPVETSLEKLEIYPGLPSRQFTYKGVKQEFDENIYTQYSVDYGKDAYRTIEKIVTKESVKKIIDGDNEAKKEFIIKHIKGQLDSLRSVKRLKAIKEQIGR